MRRDAIALAGNELRVKVNSTRGGTSGEDVFSRLPKRTSIACHSASSTVEAEARQARSSPSAMRGWLRSWLVASRMQALLAPRARTTK